IFAFAFLSQSLFAAPFKVVVDPGHGGTDAGAVGKQNSTDIKESTITLAISKLLANRFKQDSNIEVILTRESDSSLNLNQRSKIAKQSKADLFISVHANSSTDISAKGAEVYFQSQMPPDEESLFLASRENEGHVHEIGDDVPSGDLAIIIDDIKKSQSAY